MCSNQSVELPQPKYDVFNCLAAGCRRRILAILVERSAPATEEELARELGAVERDRSAEEVPENDLERIQISLRHNHLPKLDDVGLVEWDRTGKTVHMADHPIVDDPGFEQLLYATGAESDKLIACLADEHRRAILEVLESNGGELSFEKLARAVSHRVNEKGLSERDSDVRTLLHHVHLPRLDEADLVDYQGPDGQVHLESNRPRFTITNL